MAPLGRWLAGLTMALLLSACATPQVSRLTPSVNSAQIEDVPFFAQSEYQCGPAALAMLAQHAGVKVLPDELTAQVFVPGRRGSFQAEMLAAARRQGLVAFALRPELQDVLREVAAGHPVLVFQNLSLQAFPMWHYAVVIGYDVPARRIVLHSGLNERMDMSLYTFERTWARAGYWSMVALPPADVPASATASSFSAAAAGLERVNPAAAATAYRAVLARWPQTREAMLGLGNAAYAQGQKEAAAARFAEAVRAHPDFADAWHNLAQVQLEQGDLDAAAKAAAQAVEWGGPRLPRYKALQLDIEQARVAAPAASPH